MILADVLLSIASVIFMASVIPQIVAVIEGKSAIQLSWAFLFATSFSIILFAIGKFMVQCYVAAIIDVMSFLLYLTLVSLKFYYNNNYPARNSGRFHFDLK